MVHSRMKDSDCVRQLLTPSDKFILVFAQSIGLVKVLQQFSISIHGHFIRLSKFVISGPTDRRPASYKSDSADRGSLVD